MATKTKGWTFAYHKEGDWHWYFDLPNGWTACVHDYSQLRHRPTTYLIAANNGADILSGKEEYATFEEAKRAALELAMSPTHR